MESCYNENNVYKIESMRAVHFEKLLPNKDARKGSGEKRVYRKFCSFGYYNQMSYARAEKSSIMNYKHTFLVKYPYERSQNWIMADQMFMLLNEEQSVSSPDPFECENPQNAPFIGIILVTVSKCFEFKEDKVKKQFEKISQRESGIYKYMVSQYKMVCEELGSIHCTSKGKKCFKVFETPNCADLCIVIRTDCVDDIYKMKKLIPIEGEKKVPFSVCYITSYTMFELTDQPWKEEVFHENKGTFVELRLSAAEEWIKQIQDELDLPDVPEEDGKPINQRGTLTGITGSGKYALELNFETFMHIYPIIWEKQLQNELPEDWKKQLAPEKLSPLQKIIVDAVQYLDIPYMRIRYKAEWGLGFESESKQYGKTLSNTKLIQQFEKALDNKEEWKDHVEIAQILRINNQKALIKELMYTYNDLWFRPSTWWKGLFFYTQIDCMLAGLKTYRDMINEDYKSTAKLVSNFCEETSQAVSDVNNFNKLLQSVSQYVANVPNYEIQTKVNAEKYLLAYSMYLLQICRDYYKSHADEGVAKIFPFFSINYSVRYVEAQTLFSDFRLERPEASGVELFSVKCPNYQWFANVYHVLPMVTHEVAHSFRFIGRSERNRSLIRFAARSLFRQFTGILLSGSVENYCYEGYFGSRERFLLDALTRLAFPEEGGAAFQGYQNRRISSLASFVKDEFAKFTGIPEKKNKDFILWNVICDNVCNMAEITKFRYLMPGEILDEKANMQTGYEILVNVVLDILCGEKNNDDIIKQWKARLKEFREKNNLQNDNLTDAQKELRKTILGVENSIKLYEDEKKLSIEDISLAWRVMVTAWENYDSEFKIFVEKNEEIGTIWRFLQNGKCQTAMNLLQESKKEKAGDKGNRRLKFGQEEKYYEKLTCLCTKIANINSISRYHMEDFIVEKKDVIKDFAVGLHKELGKEYQDKINHLSLKENQWVVYQDNHDILTSLGVIDDDSERFVDKCRQALKEMAQTDWRKKVDDVLRIYKEIFADLGMCKAFNFSAYGYYMFCVHMFTKQIEFPVYYPENLMIDRMRGILLGMYADETIRIDGEPGQLEQSLNGFFKEIKTEIEVRIKEQCPDFSNRMKMPEEIQKLCKVSDFSLLSEQVVRNAILKMKVLSIKTPEDELNKHLEMLRWMCKLYKELGLAACDGDPRDGYTADLYEHIRYVNKYIDDKAGEDTSQTYSNEEWIKNCQQDDCLQDIGRYYNNYSYYRVVNYTSNGHCMDVQHKFIFDNYAKICDLLYETGSQIEQWSKDGEYHAGDILDFMFPYESGVSEDKKND